MNKQVLEHSFQEALGTVCGALEKRAFTAIEALVASGALSGLGGYGASSVPEGKKLRGAAGAIAGGVGGGALGVGALNAALPLVAGSRAAKIAVPLALLGGGVLGGARLGKKLAVQK